VLGVDGLTIRPLEERDIAWAEGLLGAAFGGRHQARLGELVDPLAHPGLVAELDGRPAGVVTYVQDGDSVEISYLETVVQGAGVGTELVDAVEHETGASRLWLVTTNDNLDALRFYQRRRFRISEIRPGAVDEARRSLKPTIPDVGRFGIPIRDEIILERRHSGATNTKD
jgi:ribosomal protein S18 acetylase RimI-like enzyme